MPTSFLSLPPPLRRTLLAQIRSLSSSFSSSSSSSTTTTTTTTSNHASAESPPPPPPILTLTPSTLNTYTTTPPPTPAGLKRAHTRFTSHSPVLLYSTPKFHSLPPSPFPEVSFLGRSNVGKSSLLNALLGRPHDKPAHVSKRPGRTKTMNGFGVGGEYTPAKRSSRREGEGRGEVDPAWKRFNTTTTGTGGGFVVVDMPGYGSGSREDWGTEILKFLSQRTQLRRTYVLVDSEHGLKRSDVRLLLHLRQHGIPHQLVLSKVDKILYPTARHPTPRALSDRLMRLREMCLGIRRQLNGAAGEAGGRDDDMGDILCCSAEKRLEQQQWSVKGRSGRIGIDEIRWSILTACGLETGSSEAEVAVAANGANFMLDSSGPEPSSQTSAFTPM